MARLATAEWMNAGFVLRFDGPAMRDPRSEALPAPSQRDPVLVYVAAAWCIPAAVVSFVALGTVGRLSPVVLAVDVIAAFLLPFALLWLVLTFLRTGEEPPRGSDDSGGGGQPPTDSDPVPPPGGLDIDWEQFEADLQTYARSREMIA